MEKISPISIDLGAKNTGVFFAHYSKGASLEDIKKDGKVYTLEKDAHTLLMANRTAARHARRAIDRRKMAKRLFRLVWEQHLNLAWDSSVQQTIGFLMNRRGFSFLTETVDKEILDRFPPTVYELLPTKAQTILDGICSEYTIGKYCLDACLQRAAQQQDTIDKLDELHEELSKKPKDIKSKLLVIGRIEKLQEYCDDCIEKINELKKDCIKRIEDNHFSNFPQSILTEWKEKGIKGIDLQLNNTVDVVAFLNQAPLTLTNLQTILESISDVKNNNLELTEKNLSNLSQWILDKWKDKGIKGIANLQPDSPSKKTVNVVVFLNQASPTTLETISASILKILPDLKNEKKELKDDRWNFDTSKFKTTSLENITNEDKKTHLHHLAYAVYSIDQELKTGGRYRSLYFKEIEEVLETTDTPVEHKENYLKTFCEKLHNKNFAPLTPETLKNLIAHISNLELKPLRKYFNDIKYKNGDSWNEPRIANIFNHWICNEWRVDKNDKNKAQDYTKLKKQWKAFTSNPPKKVIDFWLELNPDYTIPPYQNNNNRRPPKCQSFILNVNYLNSRYKNWQQWVKKDLQNIDVENYLDGYKKKLQGLKSGKEKPYFTVESVGNKKESIRSDAHLQARVLQFIFDRIKASDSLKLNEIYSHAKKIRQNFSGDEKNQKDNEAWEEIKIKLENAIDKSELPPSLKSKPDYNNKSLFTPGSFLHLICKYYKLRQRAKEGRIFIHPQYKYSKERGYENTGHFNDTDHLLSYCNHKPRQKRHQLFFDVAGLIQITPEKLKQKLQKYVKSIVPNTEDEPSLDELVQKWLDNDSNKGLASACADVAKLQKERRGELKTDINRIYELLYRNDLYSFKDISDDKQSNKKDILAALKKSEIKDADEIYKLYKRLENAKEKWKNLIAGLYDDNDDIEKQRLQNIEKLRLQKNPVAAIFQLAQLNNIAFQDRSGNASTCPVCSADNAERMASDKNDNDHSKAQRLPAIKTRIIDGAVMKMARVLAKAIANDKWAVIEKELQNGTAVSVPIITESNRFEFEPNLREIKNKAKDTEKAKKTEKAEEKLKNNILEKDQRIKDSSKDGSNYICAYSGASIGNDGELDHIIPRQSRWGTLNDEANLIYVTQQANRKKSNQPYTLSNLDPSYKSQQFNKRNDQEIKAWIIEQIGDGSTNSFKFDRYNSFINLSRDEQKAFRHALFLDGTAIQKQVINAINNRTRALVNGTQRYFAETLANELYKLAKAKKLETKLCFDYFGIEAGTHNQKINIYELRKQYENSDSSPIKVYSKEAGVTQDIYSHLIDAMLAFVIAADAHRNNGGLKIKISDYLQPFPPRCLDAEAGKIIALDKIKQYTESNPSAQLSASYEGSFLQKIWVGDASKNNSELKRLKPTEKTNQHRQFTRDKHYGIKFIPLLLKKEGNEICLAIGYNWKNSIEIIKNKDNKLDKKSKELLQDIIASLKYAKNPALHKHALHDFTEAPITLNCLDVIFSAINNQYKNKNDYLYIDWDKTRILDFWMKSYNTNQTKSHIGQFLEKISYRTERIRINKLEIIQDMQDSIKLTIKTKYGEISSPFKQQWEQLYQTLKNTDADEFNKKLKDYFSQKEKKDVDQKRKLPHQRTRKEYSLPVVTGEGKFLLTRKSWNGDKTLQIVNDSDSRKPDNKLDIPVRTTTGARANKLAKWAQSDNILRLTEKKHEQGEPINPTQWYEIDNNKFTLPPEISHLYYRIDDSTAPSIGIILSQDGCNIRDAKFMDEQICKKNSNQVKDSFFQDRIKKAKKGDFITYKGSSYNKEMDKAFETAIESETPSH